MKRSAAFSSNERPYKQQKHCANSGSEDGDLSCSSSSGSISQYGDDSATTTPATPLTPKLTSRYPSDLKTLTCNYPGCKKSFNRPAKLAQHFRSHTNTRPFACTHDQCRKTFLRQSHLSHHVKSAHSNIRQHMCSRAECGKAFVTATRLKRHEALHEGREKFKCHEIACGQTFRKHGTLERHVMEVHERRKPFICNYLVKGKACGAALDTAAKLKAHHGRVHGEVRFWCQICEPPQDQIGYTDMQNERPGFTTHRDLQTHLKTVHRPVCTQCGLQSSSTATFKTHMEVQHGEVGIEERRSHMCPNVDCGLAFTSRNVLRSHIRTKHEGKQFICGDPNIEVFKKRGGWNRAGACGQPFPTKGNLERHITTIHLKRSSDDAARRGSEQRKPRASQVRADPLTWLTGESDETVQAKSTPWTDQELSTTLEKFSQSHHSELAPQRALDWTPDGHAFVNMGMVEDGIHFGADMDDNMEHEWLEDELEMRKLIS